MKWFAMTALAIALLGLFMPASAQAGHNDRRQPFCTTLPSHRTYQHHYQRHDNYRNHGHDHYRYQQQRYHDHYRRDTHRHYQHRNDYHQPQRRYYYRNDCDSRSGVTFHFRF